jgi:hypothetical protein
MAIDSYAKLQSAIADTVNRDDLAADVTTFSPAAIDGMIKRAIEYGTHYLNRNINARGGIKFQETVSNALATVAGTETVTLPTDFAGARTFYLATDPITILEFVDPTTLFTQYPSAATGTPLKYTIVGTNTAYLRPIPDSAYTTRLIYYAKIPALSDTDTTNWVLTNGPDVYIAAAMIELCIYLENDDRLQFWKGKLDEAINDMMGDDRQVRWAAVPSKPNLQVSIA